MNPDPSSIRRSLNRVMTLQFAVGGAFMPFVTLLLRDRGMSEAQVAHTILASSSTLLVFPFLWGMMADRFVSMERVFTILNLLVAGALWWFASTISFWGSLLAYTLFYASFNPILALINALCFHHLDDPHQFAAIRSWGSVGWIIPSLPISIWLLWSGSDNLAFLFPLTIGLTLVSAAATFSLPHTPPGGRRTRGDDSPRLPYWPAMKRLLGDPNYVTLLLSFFLMAGSFSILVFYSPLQLVDTGVHRGWIGPIQVIGVIVEVVLFRWKPGFIKGWNYPTSILVGCSALLIRQLLFALTDNIWLLCGSYLLAGAVIVFYHISVSLLVNARAEPEVRATAQTLLVLFGPGLGPMFSNWTAGELAQRYPDSLRPIFLFATALAALATLLIFIRRNHLSRSP